MTGWIPDHDAMLRENFAKGLPLSYAEIAVVLNRQFGTDYSRNAAIGRSNRLGLKCVKRIKREPGSKSVRTRKSKEHQRPDIAIRKARSGPKLTMQLAELRCDPVPAGTLLLLELEHGMCRYPTGDGSEMRFCGRPQFADTSYCGSHCLLVYRPDRKAT